MPFFFYRGVVHISGLQSRHKLLDHIMKPTDRLTWFMAYTHTAKQWKIQKLQQICGDWLEIVVDVATASWFMGTRLCIFIPLALWDDLQSSGCPAGRPLPDIPQSNSLFTHVVLIKPDDMHVLKQIYFHIIEFKWWSHLEGRPRFPKTQRDL